MAKLSKNLTYNLIFGIIKKWDDGNLFKTLNHIAYQQNFIFFYQIFIHLNYLKK